MIVIEGEHFTVTSYRKIRRDAARTGHHARLQNKNPFPFNQTIPKNRAFMRGFTHIMEPEVWMLVTSPALIEEETNLWVSAIRFDEAATPSPSWLDSAPAHGW